jgi:hypothetical protein
MFWPYIFVLILLIPILAIVLDSQVGRALASRLERGRVPSGDDIDKERIQYLEAELERLTGEVSRLSEESDFLHRLLTEGRGGDEGDPPPGQRDGPG